MNRIATAVLACTALIACQKQSPPASAPGPDAPTPQAAAKRQHVAQVAKSYDGPFGLKAGVPVAELEKMGFKEDERHPGTYDGTPPKPLDGADSYIGVASQESGLCKVLASVPVPTVNGTGDQIRSAVDRVAEMMQLKYGKHSSKIEYAREDVYERNPEFWTMGLSKDSVVYAYDWQQGKTAQPLPADIEDIEIVARASSMSSGWVAIRYTFTNAKACLKEIQAKKAANL